MATEPWAARAAGADRHCSDERWQLMWSQREQLLKVARRRSMSLEDAEDAVHEAMLRAMERPHLDPQRLPAWLTTVTIRLCADRHRQLSREAEVGGRATLAAPPPAPVEELVCDRDEASWVARRSGELPGRQAEALWLKSEELDVSQVARRMGLSYRTVESLLARARRTLRNSLAGTLAVALWLCGRGRPRTGGGLQSVAVVSTVATLTVLGIAVPGVHDGGGPERERRHAGSSPGPGARDGAESAGGPWRSRAGLLPASDAGAGARGAASPLLPGALPGLPSLPRLGVDAAGGVPELPLSALLPGLVPGETAGALSVPPLPAGTPSASPEPFAPSERSAPPVTERLSGRSGLSGSADGAGADGDAGAVGERTGRTADPAEAGETAESPEVSEPPSAPEAPGAPVAPEVAEPSGAVTP